MANEPETPMEKLLRAAAQKRRDEAGAPFELHPATRRLLQGEVARQFAKPQPERRSLLLFLAQLWPRLALSVVVLAAFGVVVWLALPARRGGDSAVLMARNQPLPEAAPARKVQPSAPAASTPPTLESAKAPQPQSAVAANRERAEPPPRSPAAKPSSGQKQLEKESLQAAASKESVDKLLPMDGHQNSDRKKAEEPGFVVSGGSAAQSPARAMNGASEGRLGLTAPSSPLPNAPSAPAAPPPVAATAAPASTVAAEDSAKLKDGEPGRQSFAYESESRAASAKLRGSAPGAMGALGGAYMDSLKAEKSLEVSQRFAQVTKGPKAKAALSGKAAPAHPLLASFQVEQSGSALRIVDGDGSVYRGSLRLADTTQRERANRSEPPAPAAAAWGAKAAPEEKPAARLDVDEVLPQTYLFRVTGTNRSLHKKVVFSGTLSPGFRGNKPAAVSTNLSVVNSLDGFQTGSSHLSPVSLFHTRISGKVVVGNGKAVEINAEPVSP